MLSRATVGCFVLTFVSTCPVLELGCCRGAQTLWGQSPAAHWGVGWMYLLAVFKNKTKKKGGRNQQSSAPLEGEAQGGDSSCLPCSTPTGCCYSCSW